MLRNQRGSNGRGAEAAIAVNQPLMQFARATKMPESWAMALMVTLTLVRSDGTRPSRKRKDSKKS